MTAKTAFKKFTLIAVVLGLIAASIIAFLSLKQLLIFSFAYLISYAFIASNFFVMSKRNIQSNKRFYTWFAGSFALRFLGVIIAVLIGLKVLNSYQIFFTVSFIFSYLCHSLIEIIYLNKILKTDT